MPPRNGELNVEKPHLNIPLHSRLRALNLEFLVRAAALGVEGFQHIRLRGFRLTAFLGGPGDLGSRLEAGL